MTNAYTEGLGPKWAKIAEFWAEPLAHPEVIDTFLFRGHETAAISPAPAIPNATVLIAGLPQL